MRDAAWLMPFHQTAIVPGADLRSSRISTDSLRASLGVGYTHIAEVDEASLPYESIESP
jgi:hypothetical protein